MSGKTRVYVGVRVKTTVKDLLLQHRAREANRKKQKTVNRELKELCASTFPSRHSEAPPTDITNCSSPAPTLAAFSVPDSSWNLQMQVNMFRDVQHHHHQQQQQQQQQHHHHQQEHHHHQQQQHHHHQQQQQLFGDAALLNNDYSSTTRVTSDYNSPLPPLPSSSPLPWCHVASTDADYYDHGMAPHSSSESLCNPPDPSSYSPHDSFSSSSSSCFDSPTRMDCSYGGLLSDHYPYQNHHPHQQSWANQQEAPRPTEYASFFSPTDYRHTCPVDGSFFRKDSPLSSEACYNIL